MIINELDIKSFRNYEYQSLSFSDRVNIIYGDNAQGKTNILEAIYLSATSKSQRTKNDREMISFNAVDAHIRSDIKKNDNSFLIDIHLRKNGSKGVAVNKFPISKLSELFEIVDVVFFSPEDLNIVKNSPSDRRRWVDYKLSSINKSYYNCLLSYNKILKNRNALLGSCLKDKSLPDTISVWDSQLISYGRRIIELREAFISAVNKIIEPIHSEISGKKDRLSIKYLKNTDSSDFEKKLSGAFDRDKRSGFTSIGPHRDDIMFLVNERDAKQYASQGQQKSVVLSLKLSEIDLIYESKKDMPILLLDDVLSELDGKRQKYLLDAMQNTQTIITCTGIDDFVKMRYDIDRLFYVENGNAVRK